IHQQYATLIEALRDCAIYTLDLEGNIVGWSANAERMKGYTEEEALGRNISRFYTPEEANGGHHLQGLRLAAEQGRFEEDGWRIRKDGSRFWAHAVTVAVRDRNGAVEGFFKVTRDITERMMAQDRFRLAVESAPNGMVMVNQEGKIVLVNSQTEKLFG